MSEILTEDGAVYMVVDALYHVATLFGTVLNVRNIFFMSNKRGSNCLTAEPVAVTQTVRVKDL